MKLKKKEPGIVESVVNKGIQTVADVVYADALTAEERAKEVIAKESEPIEKASADQAQAEEEKRGGEGAVPTDPAMKAMKMVESYIRANFKAEDYDSSSKKVKVADRESLMKLIESAKSAGVGYSVARIQGDPSHRYVFACESKSLREEPDLCPQYDSRKSFYGKAEVVDNEDGSKTLFSYSTPVCKISEKGEVNRLRHWDYSPTTLRHVKEFLKQNGFKADSASQIEKDYPLEEAVMKDGKLDMIYAQKMTDVMEAQGYASDKIKDILTGCGLSGAQADSLMGGKKDEGLKESEGEGKPSMRTEQEIRDKLKTISGQSPYSAEAAAAAVLEWVLGEKADLRKAVKAAISGEDEDDEGLEEAKKASPDLNDVKGTVANVLMRHKDEIDAMFADPKATSAQMSDFIVGVIQKEAADSPHKKADLVSFAKGRTKQKFDILQHVYNSRLGASGAYVDPDKKWANLEPKAKGKEDESLEADPALKALDESAKVVCGIEDFEPHDGAVATLKAIEDAGKLDALDFLIEDQYPEGIGKTDLNHLLWFEADWLFDMLGIGKESAPEDGDDEPVYEGGPEGE